jgi:hypothetical protein
VAGLRGFNPTKENFSQTIADFASYRLLLHRILLNAPKYEQLGSMTLGLETLEDMEAMAENGDPHAMEN